MVSTETLKVQGFIPDDGTWDECGNVHFWATDEQGTVWHKPCEECA